MFDPIRKHNQNVSSIQITAEQLILESVSRTKDRPRLPELENQTQAEIDDLRFKRRQAWERNVSRNLCTYNTFIRYARWEEDIGEIDKARSVYERALEFSRFREPTVWICYVDMELRHKQIAYALNVLERSITILPRHDRFWLKYALLLESLGNIEGTRELFQRWIAWEPPPHAFLAFVEFESRVGEFTRARSIFERLLIVHPFENSFLRYADFELKLKQFGRVRNIFERGVEILQPSELLITRFAQFEESEGEVERSHAIFKYGIERLPSSSELKEKFLGFEKRYGGGRDVEDAVIQSRISRYEQILEKAPMSHEVWFELTQLRQTFSSVEVARATFERALSNRPTPSQEKRDWGKFVLIGISFATFEEKIAKNIENARAVFHRIISIVPHKKFTFSRIWILYAYFEIRHGDLRTARTILGHALGTCPRSAIFDAYIEIELLLRNDDRVRILLRKFVETIPSDLRGWVKFAQFESGQGHIDEARGIFEAAIESQAIDSTDLLWSVYIDFESKVGDVQNIRNLYRRGIEAQNQIDLWKGWIILEADVCGDVDAARRLFDRAEISFAEDRAGRKRLRDYRVAFEMEFGDDEAVVHARTRVAKVNEEDGTFIFPEEDEASVSSLLEAADRWADEVDKQTDSLLSMAPH
jgi:crooked neck